MPKSKQRKISATKLQEKAKQEASKIIALNKNMTISIITYASILAFGDMYKRNESKRLKEFIRLLKVNLVAIRDNEIKIKEIAEVLKEEYELDIESIFKLEE